MPDITDVFTREDWERYGRDSFINWGHIYSQREFLEGAEGVFGLRHSLEDLAKNTGNHLAKKGIVSLLMPRNPMLGMSASGGSWVEAGTIVLKDQEDKLARYSARNHLEGKLDKDALNALVLKLGDPENCLLYNTSPQDKKTIEVIKRQNYIVTGHLEGLRADFPKLIEEIPEWHQVLFSLNQNNPEYMTAFTKSYASIITDKYNRAFKTGDNYDRGKFLGFYGRSIAAVNAQMHGRTPEQREAIWKEKLKPVHLMTAETLFAALQH